MSPVIDSTIVHCSCSVMTASRLVAVALILTIATLTVISPLAASASTTADSGSAGSMSTIDDRSVQKADEIHREAMRSLDANDSLTAINKEQQAEKLTPDYWLPHAALSYLYLGRGGPAITEAELSVATKHPNLADINMGLMFQWFQMYDKAFSSFSRALEAEPTNLEAKVGIAGCLIAQGKLSEGRKIIDEAYAKAPADPHLLDAIARTYFDCGDLNKTKEVCKKALECTSDPKEAASLRRLELVAAVNTSDSDLLFALKDKVAPQLEPYELAWMRAGQLRLAHSTVEASALLRFAEAVKTSGLAWNAYASVLQQKAESALTDKAEWMQLAKQCLENAEGSDPNRLQNRILLASFEEKDGNTKAAVAKITEGWHSTIGGEPNGRTAASDLLAKSELTRLAVAIAREGSGYHSYITAVEYKLPKATCHCRYSHMREAVKLSPGVIDVIIGSGGKPSSMVLFDSRKASRNSIFESKAVKVLHETCEIISKKHIQTIAQLGDLVEREQAPLAAPYLTAERVKLRRPWPEEHAHALSGTISRVE